MECNTYEDTLQDIRNKLKDAHLHDNQDVQWVVVVTECLRNKAVVVGIDHTAVQNSIHKHHSRCLVQLVLHFRAPWNFDDSVEQARGVFADVQIMPWVTCGVSSNAKRSIQLNKSRRRETAKLSIEKGLQY